MTLRFWRIVWAIAAKELRQIVRDRTTAALLVGVPFAQILLFGYAIDLAPRQWPTAWVQAGPADALVDRARALLEEERWFRIARTTADAAEAGRWMQRGEVAFIVVWPPKASLLVRAGETPEVRFIADGSDPFAAAALGALERRLAVPDSAASAPPGAETALPVHVQIEVHHAARFGAGEYLVPALAGVILTLTLTLLAALAIVREVERGTWHGLLTTPAGAAEIVLGKLLPYLALGSALFAALITLAHGLFGTAFGHPMLWLAAALFMLANLGLGLALSFAARTQMQAMQMGIFFYLPSILLSGFMFPFHAMPAWARAIGEALPLTHFLRCLRASLVRGADGASIAALGWPIAAFAALALLAALIGARRAARG
jgi:ABC-2 type transport system permease protein